MALDPVSMALAGAGIITDLMKQSAAKRSSKENLAYQQQQLQFQQANALAQQKAAQEALINQIAAIRSGSADQLSFAIPAAEQARRLAGATRTDQFGNRLTYDPGSNEWKVQLSPGQQAKQERTAARGAQASEDYNRLRAEYAYRTPPSEESVRDEIFRLITQARGEGDRALNTLVNRQELRQRGNLPVIISGDTAGSDAGARLAETLLRARQQALTESTARQQAHQQQYLPAMRQFEETANFVDPTGAALTGQGPEALQTLLATTARGNQDILGIIDSLTKQLSGAYAGDPMRAALQAGGAAVGGAYGDIGSAISGVTKAEGAGPDFARYIAALRPTAAQLRAGQSGTTGGTTGARTSTSDTAVTAPTWDRRFNFGPTTKGVGTEAAPLGGASPIDYGLAQEMPAVVMPWEVQTDIWKPEPEKTYWQF